ncbi:hypothetical protein [Mycolicibacterium aurum]|uniref:hypothetical protein n=1 Tax=Mycolicibacterium aurum TaxID=1791 RepID=UPI003556C565
MDGVSEAVATIGEQLAVLSTACDELSHRDLISLLVQVSAVVRAVPALEHRALARLTAETEPCRLGEKTWPGARAGAPRAGAPDRRDRAVPVGRENLACSPDDSVADHQR